MSLLPFVFVRPARAQSAPKDGQPFSRDTVPALAEALSKKPFAPMAQAPQPLTQLNYDTYRRINYRPNEAIWGGTPTKFSIELFAPGFLYRDLVDIDVVENGLTYPLAITPDSFDVPDPALTKYLVQAGKFAGFRLHYPLNRPDVNDEFLVFQGASYFRGVSKGQRYGLSARGLAIDVAEPTGEEHPIFRRFWIERPSATQDSVVVHALLDSRRVSGAYRFGIYPGAPLVMDVDVKLFPRRDLPHVGLAPLTSMFMHGPLDHSDFADYRPQVHDSDGLAMITGAEERIWRPLNNPKSLQISAFLDTNPKGFGLIQRDRRFTSYEDLEALYHLRPSAWVAPKGDWGPGHVQLVEIPSDFEANDNIVAYWRPNSGLKAGQPYAYSYRLSWPNNSPQTPHIAQVVRSASGSGRKNGPYEYVVDFDGPITDPEGKLDLNAWISSGSIIHAQAVLNPETGGTRVYFKFNPEGAVAEIRLQLLQGGKPVGETWLYRWINE